MGSCASSRKEEETEITKPFKGVERFIDYYEKCDTSFGRQEILDNVFKDFTKGDIKTITQRVKRFISDRESIYYI